ncbi:hypothetical protein ACOSQ3_014775 [Xanthoceras sorbifolium]
MKTNLSYQIGKLSMISWKTSQESFMSGMKISFGYLLGKFVYDKLESISKILHDEDEDRTSTINLTNVFTIIHGSVLSIRSLKSNAESSLSRTYLLKHLICSQYRAEHSFQQK